MICVSKGHALQTQTFLRNVHVFSKQQNSLEQGAYKQAGLYREDPWFNHKFLLMS